MKRRTIFINYNFDLSTRILVTAFIAIQLVYYTDKKENNIFLIYKEIQSGAVAKSYVRKGFLLYDEMRQYFRIYE